MVESPNNIACSVICVCPHYNLVIAPDGTNMHEREGENGRSKNIEEWGQSYPLSILLTIMCVLSRKGECFKYCKEGCLVKEISAIQKVSALHWDHRKDRFKISQELARLHSM